MTPLASFWTTTHIMAHVLIFFGYIAAMALVPGALRALIQVSRVTVIAGAGFFLFCGITHLGLALHDPYSPIVTVCDHVQAGCIAGFVLSLIADLRRASRRLVAAYTAIGARFGRETAVTVQATIESALGQDT